MRFHDAELMRVRAHTFTEPEERRDALAAALEFARHQGATLFELRCLLDSFDLSGTAIGPGWPTLSAASPVTLVGRNSHGHNGSSRDPPPPMVQR